MKHQALRSSKDKSTKIKVSSAAFLVTNDAVKSTSNGLQLNFPGERQISKRVHNIDF